MKCKKSEGTHQVDLSLETATLHQFTMNLDTYLLPWTEIKPQMAIEKNIRKATWISKILRNKSTDRDSNFLVMFLSSKT